MTAPQGVIRWEDPPPAMKRGSSPLHIARARQIAAELRERPGDWALIAWGLSNRALVTRIRQGTHPVWQPAGTFESAARIDDGRLMIYARYVGKPDQ